jgi:cytochrome o ubiquinol oxidase subunit 1
MGATRRLSHYDASTGWHPYFVVALIGALIIFAGIGFFVVQVVVSILQRKNNMDLTGDPWDGRTLEWDTASPPPFYNFAFIPHVHSLEPHWDNKQAKLEAAQHPERVIPTRKYEPIHMPKNTAIGVMIGVFGFFLGFALIWDIWWLVVASGFAIFACVAYRSFDYDIDYYVTAEEVERTENKISNRVRA